MKTDRKPPLAKSSMKIRTRQALKPTNFNTHLQTPIGSMGKTQMKGYDMRPENHTVCGQLKALAKMVENELGALSNSLNGTKNNSNEMGCSLFERGRYYEVYSARRNERLKKKKKQSETGEIDEPKSGYNLGVKVESTKKKKTVAASYSSVDRTQHHRYSLRSTTKKPPLPPVPMNVDETSVDKRVGSRTRRK